jgi:hypothetical protein
MANPKGLKTDLNGNTMHIRTQSKCSYKGSFTIKSWFHSVLKTSEYFTLSNSNFPSWATTKHLPAKTDICK